MSASESGDGPSEGNRLSSDVEAQTRSEIEAAALVIERLHDQLPELQDSLNRSLEERLKRYRRVFYLLCLAFLLMIGLGVRQLALENEQDQSRGETAIELCRENNESRRLTREVIQDIANALSQSLAVEDSEVIDNFRTEVDVALDRLSLKDCENLTGL